MITALQPSGMDFVRPLYNHNQYIQKVTVCLNSIWKGFGLKLREKVQRNLLKMYLDKVKGGETHVLLPVRTDSRRNRLH
jgi:hypothetical protein